MNWRQVWSYRLVVVCMGERADTLTLSDYKQSKQSCVTFFHPDTNCNKCFRTSNSYSQAVPDQAFEKALHFFSFKVHSEQYLLLETCSHQQDWCAKCSGLGQNLHLQVCSDKTGPLHMAGEVTPIWPRHSTIPSMPQNTNKGVSARP